MSLFDFLHQHPYWGLIYLLLINFTVMVSASAFRRPEPRESKAPFPVEDRSGWPKV